MMAATFDLTFRPPTPLSTRHARLVIGGSALVMALAAIRFWVIGAWLVVPFLAIDIAILAWAFRASRRASRAYERLALVGEELLVERTDPAGRIRAWRVPRTFTRVELENHAPQDRLWLRHRGKRMLIGKHLNRRERREVYDMLARSLNG